MIGVYLMLNMFAIYEKNVRLTDDLNELMKHRSILSNNYDYEIIESNKGNEVLLIGPPTTNLGQIYLKSGK